jgi:hypothetical protein
MLAMEFKDRFTRPRQWASLIASYPKEERLAVLQQAPPEWQDLIKKHVELAFFARKHKRMRGEL